MGRMPIVLVGNWQGPLKGVRGSEKQTRVYTLQAYRIASKRRKRAEREGKEE